MEDISSIKNTESLSMPEDPHEVIDSKKPTGGAEPLKLQEVTMNCEPNNSEECSSHLDAEEKESSPKQELYEVIDSNKPLVETHILHEETMNCESKNFEEYNSNSDVQKGEESSSKQIELPEVIGSNKPPVETHTLREETMNCEPKNSEYNSNNDVEKGEIEEYSSKQQIELHEVIDSNKRPIESHTLHEATMNCEPENSEECNTNSDVEKGEESSSKQIEFHEVIDSNESSVVELLSLCEETMDCEAKNSEECSNFDVEKESPSEIEFSKRKPGHTKTGKELMNESLSLPYFSLPKYSYEDYSKHFPGVSSSEKEDRVLNNALLSNVTPMLEEVANETAICQAVTEESAFPESSILHQDISLKINSEQENFEKKGLHRAITIEKSSPDDEDDDIIFLDMIEAPSTSTARKITASKMNSSFIHAVKKSSCKPNRSFAGEIGIKKMENKKENNSLMEEAEVPGAKRVILKNSLLKQMKEKKEEKFLRNKELLHIENEEFDDESTDTNLFNLENEREETRVISEQYQSALEESDGEEDSGESGTQGDNEYESDSSHAADETFDSRISSSGKLLPATVNGCKVNNSTAKIEDNFFTSDDICFSMPSYQPHGGFSRADTENRSESDLEHLEIEETKAEKMMPHSTHTLIVISSDSEMQNCMSESEMQIASDMQIASPNLCVYKVSDEIEEIFENKPHTERGLETLSNSLNLFEDLSVSQICSGVFPSTQSEIPSSCSNSSEIICVSKVKDESSKYSLSELTSGNHNCVTKRKRTIIESSDDENEICENVCDKSQSKNPNMSKFTTGSHNNATKKKRTFIESSEDEDENTTNLYENMCDNSLSENPNLSNHNTAEEIENMSPLEGQEALSGIYQEDHSEKEMYKLIQTLINDEAELSGEEGSSDEDETGLDVVEDDEEDDVPLNYAEVTDQISQIHLKRMQDVDEQCVKYIQNRFLDAGELHADDNGQRKKKFSWACAAAVEDPEVITISDSDEEQFDNTQELEDKLKWMKEREKEEEEQNLTNEPSTSDVVCTKSRSLKMKIIGKTCGNSPVINKGSACKRKRGSLLNCENLMKQKKMAHMEETPGGPRKQVVFTRKSAETPSTSKSEFKGRDGDSDPPN